MSKRAEIEAAVRGVLEAFTKPEAQARLITEAMFKILAEPDDAMVDAGFEACKDMLVGGPDLAKAIGRKSFVEMLTEAAA